MGSHPRSSVPKREESEQEEMQDILNFTVFLFLFCVSQVSGAPWERDTSVRSRFRRAVFDIIPSIGQQEEDIKLPVPGDPCQCARDSVGEGSCVLDSNLKCRSVGFSAGFLPTISEQIHTLPAQDSEKDESEENEIYFQKMVEKGKDMRKFVKCSSI